MKQLGVERLMLRNGSLNSNSEHLKEGVILCYGSWMAPEGEKRWIAMAADMNLKS